MSEPIMWYAEFHRVPNRIKVLQLIRAEGPVSRAEIARRLDLSRPTASRIVDSLMNGGIITRVGKSQPTGGRLGDLYSFRPDAGVVLGLQLGTRDARAAVATLGGEILHRTSRRLSLDKHHAVIRQIRLLVRQVMDGVPNKPATIVSIGIAVPGVVDMASGVVTNAANLFPGLNDRPLLRELEDQFDVPVVMDNDVNFAALGESQFGCARDRRNIACLFVGSGLGAGLILNGHLLRGASGAAGEIGYMVIDRDNLYRTFTPHGSLESLAGIGRLVAGARASGLPSDSADAVCELAFTGDSRALEVVRDLNEYLAAAVVNTVALIDPEIVVLGGDLSDLPHANELFVQPIEALMRPHAIHPPRVTLSELQGDAALHGALHAALGMALSSAGRTLGSGANYAYQLAIAGG